MTQTFLNLNTILRKEATNYLPSGIIKHLYRYNSKGNDVLGKVIRKNVFGKNTLIKLYFVNNKCLI